MSSTAFKSFDDRAMSAMEMFKYVTEAEWYPNNYISYWILFTMHVTVATTQGSF
jgi:hypothetical protein